ncbi:MAG TPA: hypothetical protein VM534_05565 [Thermoanaerobaculia bacterium]|nr:hypothetical protein [Thermoanaerobaculia bacterium]
MQGFPLKAAVGAIVGVLFVVIWTQMASRPKVIINWGMIEELEGADVLIDGEKVGTLRKFGQNPTTGFEVKKGTHVVELVTSRFESEPREVLLDSAGATARLMVDIEERWDNNAVRTVLVLR